MKLESLEEFLVFSRYLNFSRAARHIGITQPTLSYRISSMERELGFDLVEHSQQPQLTPAGERFAADAEKILAAYRRTVGMCKQIAKHNMGDLILEKPACSSVMMEEFEALLLSFAHEAPSVNVRMLEHSGQALLETLVTAKSDIGFVYSRPEFIEEDLGPEFSYAPLPCKPRRDIAVYMRTDDPLAEKDEIVLDDMAGRTLILPSDMQFDSFETSLRHCIDETGANIFVAHRQAKHQSLVLALEEGELILEEADREHEGRIPSGASYTVRPYRGDEWNTLPYVIYRADNTNPALKEFLAYLGR